MPVKYYQETKGRLQNKTRERYQNLPEEEKEKAINGGERYQNLPEDEKQRLLEYRKNYFKK